MGNMVRSDESHLGVGSRVWGGGAVVDCGGGWGVVIVVVVVVGLPTKLLLACACCVEASLTSIEGSSDDSSKGVRT